MSSREGDELTQARSRLWHITALLVGWVALGTIANWAARGGGPWSAFIFTVDTLAYLTPRQEGAAWVIQVVLLHGGTVITWYIGWYLVDLVMDKHLWRNLRESKRMKEIGDLSEHVIVCGGGRVGAHLASMLLERGARFVVVELGGLTPTTEASSVRRVALVRLQKRLQDRAVGKRPPDRPRRAPRRDADREPGRALRERRASRRRARCATSRAMFARPSRS